LKQHELRKTEINSGKYLLMEDNNVTKLAYKVKYPSRLLDFMSQHVKSRNRQKTKFETDRDLYVSMREREREREFSVLGLEKSIYHVKTAPLYMLLYPKRCN